MTPCRSILFCTALLAFAAIAHARPIELIAEGKGSLDIDEQGQVEAVHIESKHGEQVNATLREQMSRWRFEPVLHEGRPVKALAHMRYLLRAQGDLKSDRLQLAIARVEFVDPPGTLDADWHAQVKRSPPAYPRQQIQRGHGAQIELVAELDDQGKVSRVAPRSGWLIGRASDDRSREQAMQQFTRASISAVKRWRFPPLPDGGNRVTIPIHYAMHRPQGSDQSALWREASAFSFETEDWMTADRGRPPVALSADGSRIRQDLVLLSELDG